MSIFGLSRVSLDPKRANEVNPPIRAGNMVILDGRVYHCVKNAEASQALVPNNAVIHSGTAGQAVLRATTADAGKAIFAGIAQAAVDPGRYGLVLRRGIGDFIADNTIAAKDRVALGSTTAGRLRTLYFHITLNAGTPNTLATWTLDYSVGQALEAASAGETKKVELTG